MLTKSEDYRGLWRIGLVTIAFVAIVLAACLLFVSNVTKESRKAVLTELENYAESGQATLIARIQGGFDTLNGVATCLSEMDRLDESTIDKLVDQINRSNSFSRMGYASLDGQVDMFDLDGSVYNADFFDHAFFQQALAGENSMANTVKDPYSDYWIVRYAVPVIKDGAVEGVLVATHNAVVFSDIVDSNVWSGYGYANIIDHKADFVIRANNPLIGDEPLSLYDLGTFTASERDTLQEIMNAGEGMCSYTTFVGDHMTVVVKSLGFNGWYLVCSLSDAYISAPYYDNAIIIVTILLMSLIIFLLLTSWFMQMLIRGQKRLRQQSEENAVVIAQSDKFMLRYDTKTKTVYNLNNSNGLFGVPAVMENYPQSALDYGLVIAESEEEFVKFHENMQKGVATTGSANIRLKLADGSVRWHHADYTLLPDDTGELTRSIISFYDNSDIMEKELAYELRRLELASLTANNAFYLEASLMTGTVETMHGKAMKVELFDGSELHLYALLEWYARSAVYPDDATHFREFFDQKRLLALHALGVFSDSLEFRAILEDALKWIRGSVQMTKYPYSEDIKLYLVFNDIDEDKDLSTLASTDMLTGLLNREATMRGIEQYLHGTGVSGTHALFMIDIDNFKEVNDTMGHQVGDEVLADLAATIRGCFRETDIVGRIGGDEFFAFMKNAGESSIIRGKANELLSNLQHLCASGVRHVNLSASIGIAVYHGNEKPAKNLNQLYTEADAALYKAKALGKNCFAFADELETLSIMPATAAAHGALALNLRSLLNNLGNGIEIYHAASAEGALTPLFCNESLLNLLGGLSEEEFFDIYGKDLFSGVHPEDRDELVAVYNAALRNRVSFQHTHRLQGLCGAYCWVTLFGNFVYYEDGSYDLYAIYSDAEQLMHNRAALQERYKTFQNLITGNTVAFFHLNLTSNRCDDGASDISSLRSLRSSGSADGFFARLASYIDSAEIASRYRTIFTREHLTDSFNKGESALRLDIPCILAQDKQMWLCLSVNMAENPDTHEIEAIIGFFDVDKETHLQYMLQRLLDTDYEFLGQINVMTGRLIIYSINSDPEKPHPVLRESHYEEELPPALKNLVREDFYEESLAALNLEHIKAELEKADTYDCIFPTNKYRLISAGFKRWRCGYIGERRRFIMISRTDVTDLISSERDNLTGLYNQQGFYNRVHEKLKAHPDIKFRLHRFDFDDFKLLNDTLGFTRGDQLLRNVGAALRRRSMRFGNEVIFARLEADHFVSFRPDDGPSAESLMAELSAWLESFSIEYKVTSHMGVYLIDDPEMDASAMCDRALLALKSIKGSFSQRVAYYDDSLRYKLIEEQELVHSMEEALAADQFEVYFQPQFNYDDGSLIGAEALVRWNHPEKGLIAPGVFIPLFERNGFITRLDEYIWEQSCQYIRKWMDSADKYLPVSVSVNISRIDIYNPHLVQILKSITEKYGISTSMLKLEITESAYMQNPEQLIRVVSELQYEGFTIEMDDFGSGYSSLNTLKDVPVDILKLDMKFLSQGVSDERGGNILSSVIRMAHWLKIPVIAEGVETKLQADYLKSLGCYYMQGYHFARPMPAEQFENLLMESKLGTTDRYSRTNLEGVAAFWDVSAQTTLLFNSFVGGAAILEYTDGKAEILRANDKFYVEINTKRQTYLGKQRNTLARFDDHNRSIFEDMLKEAVSTGSETECEVQSLPVQEGTTPFWTHNRVRLLAQNGDSYLFYLATENITDRKNLEEELHIKTEALQLSISQIGRFVCNYDILTDDLPLVMDSIRKVAENGEQVDFEHRILRTDGSVGWVRTILQKAKGINGEELIQTISHDITEQKTGE